MSLTVKELIKICEQKSAIKDMELIAGDQGLEREISGVTIIEAPDIFHFIEGGEVLLTGLYAFKSSSLSEFEAYISALANREVSAVFLKQGRLVSQAEQKINLLRKYCDAEDIPLIKVPYQVSFQLIMSVIMERLFSEEVTELKYYRTTRDNFCALAFAQHPEENSIDRILDMLNKLIRNPVALFDLNCTCLYSSNVAFREMGSDLKLVKLNPRLVSKNIYYQHSGKPNRYLVKIPLATGQTILMQVWEVTSSFTPMDIIAIENGIIALQYEFARQSSVKEIEQKFHNDLIQDVLTGELNSRSDRDRIDIFSSFCRGGDYRVVVVAYPGQIKQLEFKQRIWRTDLLKEAISRHLPSCQINYSLDQIALIQMVDPNQNLAQYRQDFAKGYEALKQDLATSLPDLHLVCGIGRAVPKIEQIHLSYKEAKNAIAYLELNSGLLERAKDCLFFSDLGIFQLLLQIEDQAELATYIPEGLDRLYQLKGRYRDDLIDTLAAYLRNQLNLSQTARDLFIHYKTAKHRIDRIVEITGLDFGDLNQVMAVRVGIMVKRLLENPGAILN